MNIQNFLLFLMELIGTIAFAASGVMVGIRKNMDLSCERAIFTSHWIARM